MAEGGRDGEIRHLGASDNTPDVVAKLVRKLADRYEVLHVCYEAGPTGYGLYRQVLALGHECMVVAPSLIPRRPGDRVRTNRRDAQALARLLRAGELTAVWVPDETHEAVRDLVRTRAMAVEDYRRKRQHVTSFLLRHCRDRAGLDDGIGGCGFPGDARCAVHEGRDHGGRGGRPAPVRASATAYGLSGPGALGTLDGREQAPERDRTKTGNVIARRALVEAAWTYLYPADLGREHQQRQQGLPRRCARYRRLSAKGKRNTVVVVAIARELAVLWAIAQHADPQPRQIATA